MFLYIKKMEFSILKMILRLAGFYSVKVEGQIVHAAAF